jgi:nitrate/nitrite transport system ATP-binding protein
MALLELKDVNKGFGPKADRTEVLRNINLVVEEGEFLAIVGYSGAGKSTLINLVAGLEMADTGTVTLSGNPVTGPGPDRGVVFQSYSLLPWLTVFENVQLAVDQLFASESLSQRKARVQSVLETVNLAAAVNKRPSELSGGMRQRVSVARALAMDPKILLLDEPLSALDALTRATLQDEFERIWEKDRKTVLMITNDVDEAILLADRIIPLSAGPAATLGPAVKVELDRPRDRKAVNHDPRFRRVRNEVIEYLLGPGGRKDRPVEPPKLTVPRTVGVAA